MKENKGETILVVILALFSALLYFNSLWGIFIFDDLHSISENVFIKDARYFPLFLKGHYTSAAHVPKGMFRPLLLMSFSFNYLSGGLNPAGYHIINIIFHFLNGILLYYFLRLIRGGQLPFGLSAAITLLFLSHPINTEAVCYITSRSDLMVNFFLYLGIICYYTRRFIWVWVLYMLALLSKESALVFPFLLSAFDLIYKRPAEQDRKSKINPLLFYFVVISISLAYWVYRSNILHLGVKSIVVESLFSPLRSFKSNLLIQLAVSLFYLKLFIWPAPLTIHHVFPELESFFTPLALFSITGVAILLILVFVLRKKYPLISLGIAWYFICLLPKFYAALHVVAAEHHFYLASFGIYLALAQLALPLYIKYRRKFIMITSGIISIFTILVWLRNYEFKDEFTFWRSAVKADPLSAVAHHNLGLVFTNRREYKEAEKNFKKTFLLAPAYSTEVAKNTRENLANVYRLQKRFPEALELFFKNIELKVDTFGTYQNLGVVYLDMGDEQEAEKMWQKGLSLYPAASGIRINLGLLYLKRNKLDIAINYFSSAITFDPDSSLAYFGLAEAYRKKQDNEAAIKAYQKVISIDPDYVLARFRLSTLYYGRKELDAAIIELEEVLKLMPNSVEAHNNLAILYANKMPPQLEQARLHARKAIFLGSKFDNGFLKMMGLAGDNQ